MVCRASLAAGTADHEEGFGAGGAVTQGGSRYAPLPWAILSLPLRGVEGGVRRFTKSMAGVRLSIDGSNLESAKVSARLTLPTMKKILLAFVLVALCGVTSCIPTSINPLYTGQDLV